MNTVPDPLVEVEGLSLATHNQDEELTLLEDLSVAVEPGEALGIIGESGSGKSLLVRSLVGLLPRGVHHTAGTVRVDGIDVTTASQRRLRGLRGARVGMVFQDSIGSLDPLFTVGKQLVEAMRVHRKISTRSARAEALRLLDEVGIAEPESRLRSYPHELSGGMAQRVAIAIAIANSPRLLIADEATTALDVTVQRQVVGLINRIRTEHECSVIFVSHDLAIVASLVDRVAVMYAGRIVELGPTDQVLNAPRHPYTAGLLRSRPQLDVVAQEVLTIPGAVPLPGEWPAGCLFHPRCPRSDDDRCVREEPTLEGRKHVSACHYPLIDGADRSTLDEAPGASR
ncbi:ABC transporter ATP-binding protein [Aeromicrobium sp. CTD01-1L150]|uniref:ABC transporter ATP-binding protein n=1 Tax=Aeromicrobium sp. CTD01-1L150 TaxID=3341830 RepID=UPI0035C13E3B